MDWNTGMDYVVDYVLQISVTHHVTARAGGTHVHTRRVRVSAGGLRT